MSEVEEDLKARLKLRAARVFGPGVPIEQEALDRIIELEAENRRLREALEKIAAPTYGTEHWNTHKERAEIYRTHLTSFQTIARAALSQEDRDGTGNEQ